MKLFLFALFLRLSICSLTLLKIDQASILILAHFEDRNVVVIFRCCHFVWGAGNEALRCLAIRLHNAAIIAINTIFLKILILVKMTKFMAHFPSHFGAYQARLVFLYLFLSVNLLHSPCHRSITTLNWSVIIHTEVVFISKVDKILFSIYLRFVIILAICTWEVLKTKIVEKPACSRTRLTR